jgi:hypothetical protein
MHSVAQWRPVETINRGVLVTPPRRLDTAYPLVTPAGTPLRSHYLEGKWTLVYISGPSCDGMCTENFYAMRQVTIAQGENMRRVQRLFMMIAGHDSLPASAHAYPQMDVAVFSASDKEAFLAPLRIGVAESLSNGRIYLVDALGNLMMYYDAGAEPGGILILAC